MSATLQRGLCQGDNHHTQSKGHSCHVLPQVQRYCKDRLRQHDPIGQILRLGAGRHGLAGNASGEVRCETTLGIDLDIKSRAVCSDGRPFDNPKNPPLNLFIPEEQEYCLIALSFISPATFFCRSVNQLHVPPSTSLFQARLFTGIRQWGLAFRFDTILLP